MQVSLDTKPLEAIVVRAQASTHYTLFHAVGRQKPSVVFFDLSRSSVDRINWGVIESIKNGKILSSKYESSNICWSPPHVIVFTNRCPCEKNEFGKSDYSSLSEDRWDIRHVDHELFQFHPCKC